MQKKTKSIALDIVVCHLMNAIIMYVCMLKCICNEK